MSRRWTEFRLELPSGATLAVSSPDGVLSLSLEVPRSSGTLAELSDALRALVVEVDARRAELAGGAS